MYQNEQKYAKSPRKPAGYGAEPNKFKAIVGNDLLVSDALEVVAHDRPRWHVPSHGLESEALEG